MTARSLGVAVWQGWPYALISGGVALAAFLALPAQSLPDKYLQGDSSVGPSYAGVALLAASLGVLTVLRTWGGRGGRKQPWRHLAVPPVLVVLTLTVLISSGGARSRWGTGLLCAAVAVSAHLSLELPRRSVRVLVLALLAAGSVLTTVGCQTQWRAADFRATGLPFVVADIPGYRLRGTYADVGVIFLAYRDVAGQGMSLDATIARSRTAYTDSDPGTRCFDLPTGHLLCIAPPFRGGNYADRDTLPAGITVRPVSATYLASYPVSGTSLPD
jgi:hypothetical protein